MSRATITEVCLLRRISEGPLRFDGVTAFQRQVITVMRERGWVALNAASRWDITHTGWEQLRHDR